ncbi:MAG: hypothetical protein WD877_02945 [Candidatus Saccharimonadales bacterium]
MSRLPEPSEQSYFFVGKEVESPLQNAAGSINGTSEDNITREVETLAATRIGAIKVGSFTLSRQEGLEIFHHDQETGETYNRMLLPNIGRSNALKLINKLAYIAHEKGKLLIASVSPMETSDGSSSTEQALELAHDFLETDVDGVEVNFSCPHITDIGGNYAPIMGYDLEAMDKAVSEFYIKFGPAEHERLMAKMPPELYTHHESWLGITIPDYIKSMSEPWLPSMASVFKGSRAFQTIVASNTIPHQREINGHMASLSGTSARVKIIAREQLNNWQLELEGSGIAVASELGVDSGREMAYRMRLGAVAVGGVTFLWRSKNWKLAVDKMITEFAQEIQQTP